MDNDGKTELYVARDRAGQETAGYQTVDEAIDAGCAAELIGEIHSDWSVEVQEEPKLKPYVVRLSLPVEAPSMGEAITTFFDMARETGWVFRVSTPAGDFMVNTEIDPESGTHRVMDVLPAPLSAAEKSGVLFNHAYTFAFSLESQHSEGDDVTGPMLRQAIINRLNGMGDDEMVEACGAPFDTYEVPKP